AVGQPPAAVAPGTGKSPGLGYVGLGSQERDAGKVLRVLELGEHRSQVAQQGQVGPGELVLVTQLDPLCHQPVYLCADLIEPGFQLRGALGVDLPAADDSPLESKHVEQRG